MFFDELNDEVNRGLQGRNQGIPMGFNRLNRYIGIRKSMYFVIGGLTGSGKTSLIDDAFVLNPVDWILNQPNPTFKLNIQYRSMERSRKYKLAKWVSRKIFLDNGIIIPISKMLNWNGDKMSKDEHDIFLTYKGYLDALEDIVTIYSGPENAVGIAKDIKEHALQRGRLEDLDIHNKIYIPDNENEITINVIDHFGLLKTTKAQPTKKQAIDKMSDELRYARDLYGHVCVGVQQFNRDISNPIRIKNGDVEPQLEDFKESAVPQEDADIVMALFDPMRYNVPDPSRYELDKLRDQYGAKYFRSLRLIKNSFGEDDVRIGLGFLGSVGMFKELPRRSEMTDDIYQSVIDKVFFLDEERQQQLRF